MRPPRGEAALGGLSREGVSRVALEALGGPSVLFLSPLRPRQYKYNTIQAPQVTMLFTPWVARDIAALVGNMFCNGLRHKLCHGSPTQKRS